MAQAEEIGAASAAERQIKNTLVAKLMIHSSELYREAFHLLDQLESAILSPFNPLGVVCMAGPPDAIRC